MTEEKWWASTDPKRMLEFLRGKAISDRKLRLFALACCQSVAHLIEDVRFTDAIVLLEPVCDRLVGQRKLKAARDLISNSPPFYLSDISSLALETVQDAIQPRSWNAAQESSVRAADAISDSEIEGEDNTSLAIRRRKAAARRAVELAQAKSLLCIFGPLPFHFVTINQTCPTPTAISLAQAIYKDQVFDRLPILADALEEAGCTDQEILEHCRGPGTHVRGCWPVDLVLGLK